MLLEFPSHVFTKAWFEEWGEENWGWATELLNKLVQHEPESAWQLINELILEAQDDEELGCVAAGPLEDLLSVHGSQFVERVEHASGSSERFQRCLAGVWGQSRFSSSVYERIQKSLGRPRADR